jgi:hypothetical protein
VTVLAVLKPGEFLPAGGPGDLFVLRLEPPARHAWRAGSPAAGTANLRGRFVTKGPGAVSLAWRLDHKPDLAGTASTPLTVTTTTMGGANSFLLPYLALTLAGTVAAGDTDADAALLLGVPLARALVLSARPGLPFAAGQDLLDPALGRVV